MTFNYSKKKAFRGLSLSNAIAVIASTWSGEVEAAKYADFMHFVHETSWKAYASLKVNDTSKNEWYQAKQYSDSIYNVIANAIADCKMRRNEFDKRNGVYGPYADIITFSVGTMSENGYEFARQNPKFFEDIKEKRYTPKNWNALVLYNFLEEAIHKGVKTTIQDEDLFSDKCIEAVGEVLKELEGKYVHTEEIDRAVSDIKEYANALGLYEYLKEISDVGMKREYHSNITIERDTEDGYTDTRRIKVQGCKVKDNNKTIINNKMTILYNDKDKVLYKLTTGENVILSSDYQINRRVEATDPSYITDTENSTEAQDIAYINDHKNIVTILDAINETKRLKRAVQRLAQTKTETVGYDTIDENYNKIDEKARKYIAKVIANYFEASTVHEKAQMIKILENKLNYIYENEQINIGEMSVKDLITKITDTLKEEENTKLEYRSYAHNTFKIYKRTYNRTRTDRNGEPEYECITDNRNYIELNDKYGELQEQINEELMEKDEYDRDGKAKKFTCISFPDILICVSDRKAGGTEEQIRLEDEIKMGRITGYRDERKRYNLVTAKYRNTETNIIETKIPGKEDSAINTDSNQYKIALLAIYEREEEADNKATAM